MRIAIVSDIHANLTAFEAVLADLKQVSPDLIVQGGDLVGSGSRPADVVDRIRDLGWPGVYGNTDEMLWNADVVAEFFRPPALAHFRDMVSRSIDATIAAIGDERLAWLRTLPERFTVTANATATAGSLAVVHASPGDCWRAPGAAASDEMLTSTYGPLGAARVIYGHIHLPYVRRLPAFTLANAGSVGLPYDGDPRASYAVVDDADITIRRVEYDIEREAAALVARQIPDAAWIAERLRTGTAY
jgi:predicted phosphodiesterase